MSTEPVGPTQRSAGVHNFTFWRVGVCHFPTWQTVGYDMNMGGSTFTQWKYVQV